MLTVLLHNYLTCVQSAILSWCKTDNTFASKTDKELCYLVSLVEINVITYTYIEY